MKNINFLLIAILITTCSCGNGKSCPGNNRNERYYGKNCKYRCRCMDQDWQCDRDTVTSNCAICHKEFYEPPLCQKENIAYNKQTQVSTKEQARGPKSRAVNGIVSNSDYFGSAYGDEQSELWWSVDLGHMSVITEIHLYSLQDQCNVNGKAYSCADFLQGVEIYVTNRTNGGRDDRDLCHTIPGSLKSHDLYKINLSPPRYGLYVLVLLKGGPYLYIVEFRVFQCTDYSYGPTCTGVCNCRDDTEVCNKVDGSCNSGCSPGYIGSDCSQECSDYTYGSECTGLCNCKKNAEVCNKVDGSCNSGCKPTYYGTDCWRECQCDPKGSQSQDCDVTSGNCRCRNNYEGRRCDKCVSGTFRNGNQECEECRCDQTGTKECSKVDGTCTCRDNIVGLLCDRCDWRTYGFSQQGCKKCRCDPKGSQSQDCDVTSGNCLCKSNYEGRRCDICVSGTFRNWNQECEECLCDQVGSTSSACDANNGRCSCKRNVSGRKCDSCVTRTYGFGQRGCEYCRCHYMGSTSPQCNVTTGQCPCRPNVEGRRCDSCAEGSYGLSQQGCTKCQCNTTGTKDCDKTDGRCTCRDNVVGSSCDKCAQDTYDFSERGCIKCECNITGSKYLQCIDGHCTCKDNVAGRNCDSCTAGSYGFGKGGCKINCAECDCDILGSQSPNCSETAGQCTCKTNVAGLKCDRCEPHTYGLSNEGCKECHCLNNSLCNQDTGSCDQAGGCSTGWKNQLPAVLDCQIKCPKGVCEESKNLDTGSIVGGVIAAILLIILMAVVLVFLFKYRRTRKERYTSSTNGHAVSPNHTNDRDLELASGDNTVDQRVAYENPVYQNMINEARTNDHVPGGSKKISPANRVDELKVKAPSILPKPKVTNSVIESEGEKPTEQGVYVNFPTIAEKRKSIRVNNLWEEIENKIYGESIMREEYESIPRGLLTSASVAEMPENKKKCRYKGMIPYDHNRVVLSKQAGDPHSDFFNASYFSDLKGDKVYIASQGTTNVNLNDFWRMIWETGTDKVIMLTKLMEESKMKCVQYWPDSGRKEYGAVKVTLESQNDYPHYQMRSLLVSKGGEDRTVLHFLFLSWPDMGVPDDTTELINFWNLITLANDNFKGKSVVHCSAGVGRTGTYLAFCYLMEKAARDKSINIHQHVKDMRYERPSMIQREEQYCFLHLALRDALMCNNSLINLAETNNALTSVVTKGRLLKEFQDLEKARKKTKDSTTAQMPENVNKNRFKDIVAPEISRVNLYIEVEGRNSYINAVFVKTYQADREVISTCRPMKDTVIDLWRMVYEYKPCCIVCFNKFEKGDQYWPKAGQKTECTPFTIKAGHPTAEREWTRTELSILSNNKMPHKTELLHFCDWDEGGDNSVSALSGLIDEVISTQGRSENRTILVQCFDGVTRSGVFCAVLSAYQRMSSENLVNVMATVKQIRRSRPQFITNQKQYKFVHRILTSRLDEAQHCMKM